MAKRTDVFLLVAIIFVSFYIHQKRFITPDGISLTLWKEDLGNSKETFICSTFWINKKFISPTSSKGCLSIFLHVLCGDIETCPGPTDNMTNLMNMKGIKIFHQNIRGLLSNLANLTAVFEKYKNIDILTLSETHITSGSFSDKDELYNIPGYKFEKLNRKKANMEVLLYIFP